MCLKELPHAQGHIYSSLNSTPYKSLCWTSEVASSCYKVMKVAQLVPLRSDRPSCSNVVDDMIKNKLLKLSST